MSAAKDCKKSSRWTSSYKMVGLTTIQLRKFNDLPQLLGVESIKRVVVNGCHKNGIFLCLYLPALRQVLYFIVLTRANRYNSFRSICRMFFPMSWRGVKGSGQLPSEQSCQGQQEPSRACREGVKGGGALCVWPPCSEKVAFQDLSLKHHNLSIYFDVTSTSKEGSRGLCSSTKW